MPAGLGSTAEPLGGEKHPVTCFCSQPLQKLWQAKALLCSGVKHLCTMQHH